MSFGQGVLGSGEILGELGEFAAICLKLLDFLEAGEGRLIP